jgi:hypothetical protein
MSADTAIVTISTRNYHHRVKALIKSIDEHVPDVRRVCCYADSIDAHISNDEVNYEIIEAKTLGVPRYLQLALALHPMELCCILKPFIIRHLFKQEGIRRILYLDTDIHLYSSMDAIMKALDDHDFVLTPHHIRPLPEGTFPDETILSHYGIYNAGMFALKKEPDTMRFVDWWANWLLEPKHVVNEQCHDQIWLNYVPVYCPSTLILRDPSYNVAFWNIVERNLRLVNGLPWCHDRPLNSFHFSRYDDLTSDNCMPGMPYCNFARNQATDFLASGIRQIWAEQGRSECLSWGYEFSHWPDGSDVTYIERRNARQYWDHFPIDANPWSESFFIKHMDLASRILPRFAAPNVTVSKKSVGSIFRAPYLLLKNLLKRMRGS